jgi:hypothetical protein
MQTATYSYDPVLKRRNRIVAWILVGIILGMAAWGSLYLRHYGFNTDPKTERYH